MSASSSHDTAVSKTDWAALRARIEQNQKLANAGQDSSPENDRATLVRRARHLAQPHLTQTSKETVLPIIVFTLGGQQFGVETHAVREVLPPREVTRLPGMPPFVRGVLNVRSRVIPAYDLRPLLALPALKHPASENTVIITYADCEFALLVETIVGLRELSHSLVRREIAGLNEKHLKGISEDGILVLDLSSLHRHLVIDDTAAPSSF